MNPVDRPRSVLPIPDRKHRPIEEAADPGRRRQGHPQGAVRERMSDSQPCPDCESLRRQSPKLAGELGTAMAVPRDVRDSHEPGTFGHDAAHMVLDDIHAGRAGSAPDDSAVDMADRGAAHLILRLLLAAGVALAVVVAGMALGYAAAWVTAGFPV
jgi:hypothetical protein